MDGNGRWATKRRLPRAAGHSRGVDAVRSTIETCARRGVEYLTLFAFSSENWSRPADEVSLLMRLFVSSLQREVGRLVENGVRMRVVGQIDSLTRLKSIAADPAGLSAAAHALESALKSRGFNASLLSTGTDSPPGPVSPVRVWDAAFWQAAPWLS